MLKPGVRILGVRPEIALVMPFIYDVAKESLGGCTVTSCTEGKHSRGSKHYVGAALDLRTRNVSQAEAVEAVQKLRVGLGADFDVVLESTHIHIEFDPKHPY